MINPQDLTAYQLRTGRGLAAIEANPHPADSSLWWLWRLNKRLDRKLPALQVLDDYYEGANNTYLLASQAAVNSGIASLFRGINANLAKLVVDAPRQRLEVWGFRTGSPQDDDRLWQVWQANRMDSEADAAHKEALILRSCPIIVEPSAVAGGLPVITPQDPMSCVVEHAAGDRRVVRAALKRWVDDGGRMLYTLYLPDRIEQWQDREVRGWDRFATYLTGNATPAWEARGGTGWSKPNPLNEVPVVVMPNQGRTRVGRGGTRHHAEHEAVIPLFDLYNKTLLDMATTSEFAAFPQRYGIGIDVDEGEQPTTPEAQAAVAYSTPEAQYRAAVDMMLTTPSPDAQFGQFAAAPLSGYIEELDQVRANIGTITFTPYHLLLNMPSSTPATGEALKAAEVGLVQKVRSDHHREKGAAWESVARLVFRLLDLSTAQDVILAQQLRVIETVWRNPETLSEAQHMDALSKLAALGAPEQAVWEAIPISPAEIKRWLAMRAAPAVVAPPPAPDAQPPAPGAPTLPA